jgi:hypothetical protein
VARPIPLAPPVRAMTLPFNCIFEGGVSVAARDFQLILLLNTGHMI